MLEEKYLFAAGSSNLDDLVLWTVQVRGLNISDSSGEALTWHSISFWHLVGEK